MFCNPIRDLGVSLERICGGRMQKAEGEWVFSFLFLSLSLLSCFLGFFYTFPYHNPFLNHFIMWVQKRFIAQWIKHYIAKIWFSLSLRKKNNQPVCHCLMFHCCSIFKCWWMQPQQFFSNHKTVTLFTKAFAYPFFLLFSLVPHMK